MTKLPSDDDELKVFLRQHRPTPPPPNPELEAQLMMAITNNPHLQKPIWRQRLLTISSSIAASLLLVWSSSQFLITTPESNASLEAFLESNWNDVTGQTAANTPSLQPDWMLEASTPY